MTATVDLAVDGDVATIRLQRPERLNAINAELVADLAAAFAGARDAEVGAIVLHGAGRAFCAGDDLKDFDAQTAGPDEVRAFVEAIQDVTRHIVEADAIVIAAVHGWAVGGGLEWMLGCDLALMADDAGFFFPEIELGLFPTGGTSTLLADRIGLARAKELLLLGERHEARRALELGLVNRVVAAEDLLHEAHDLAGRVAALPARARRNTKHVLNRAFRAPIETAMALETEATVGGFLDPDTGQRVRRRLD